MDVISTRLNPDEYKPFIKAVKKAKQTPAFVLRHLILEWTEKLAKQTAQ